MATLRMSLSVTSDSSLASLSYCFVASKSPVASGFRCTMCWNVELGREKVVGRTAAAKG